MLLESGDNQFNLLKYFTLEIEWTVDISIDIHRFHLLQSIWKLKQNFVGIFRHKKMVFREIKSS